MLGLRSFSCALACALTLVGPLHADDPPRVLARESTGEGVFNGQPAQWTVRWLQLEGVPAPTIQEQVNPRLTNLARFPLDRFQERVSSWNGQGVEPSRFELTMSVGALTPRLVSVLLTWTERFRGFSRTFEGVAAYTFDLTNGRMIEGERLFAPGAEPALLERVDAALRADPARWSGGVVGEGSYELGQLRSQDLQAVLVRPDGMEVWLGDEVVLDGERARVQLSFTALSGLLGPDLAPLAKPAKPASVGAAGALGAASGE